MAEILRPAYGLDRTAIEAAVRTLDAGGVVLLPTETVYGLACRSAFPDAVQRIYRLKGRPPDKALPFLLSDADRVDTFVSAVPRRARRLAESLWPGPLTLVLGEEGRTVALRVPDHDLVRAVLRECGGPVQATSANASGQGSTGDFATAFAATGSGVDLAIDAGPSRLGRESTLVRVTDDGILSILRAGALPTTDVLAAAPFTILCVCTGNTCRSPMARAAVRAALARHLAVAESDLPAAGFEVRSAGASASPGLPASSGALGAAERRGLSLADHRSQPLERGLAAEADLILAMTREHAARAEAIGGQDAPAVELFDPTGRDVPDPFGASDETYLRCLERLEHAAESWLPWILARNAVAENP